MKIEDYILAVKQERAQMFRLLITTNVLWLVFVTLLYWKLRLQ